MLIGRSAGMREKKTNREINKADRTTEKVAVTKAKTIAFERLYAALGDKSGDKKLYQFVKTVERKARD